MPNRFVKLGIFISLVCLIIFAMQFRLMVLQLTEEPFRGLTTDEVSSARNILHLI